jgi:hypothetical protein
MVLSGGAETSQCIQSRFTEDVTKRNSATDQSDRTRE